MNTLVADSTPDARIREILLLGRRLVRDLAVCARTSRLYEGENVTVRRAAAQAVETLDALRAAGGEPRLEIVGEHLRIGDTRLKPDAAGHHAFRYLARRLAAIGAGAVSFSPSLSAADLIGFAKLIDPPGPARETTLSELRDALATAGIQAITVEAARDLIPVTAPREEKGAVLARASGRYFRAIRVAREILGRREPVSRIFASSKRAVRELVDSVREEETSLLALARIKNYDEYTFNHSVNVAVYSIALGQMLGLDRRSLTELGLSALFHDLGKTAIPREVLNRPGRLDAEDWEMMKLHPVFGVEQLLSAGITSRGMMRSVLVAFRHHLRRDLSGYPEVRHHRDLDLFSGIVSVADTFDALTTRRVYRRSCLLPHEAVGRMLARGPDTYEPALVKMFLRTVGVFPVGSVVRFDSGEVGIVSRTNRTEGMLARPRVRLLADGRGLPLDGPEIDLAESDARGNPLRKLVATIDPADYFPSIDDYLRSLV